MLMREFLKRLSCLGSVLNRRQNVNELYNDLRYPVL